MSRRRLFEKINPCLVLWSLKIKFFILEHGRFAMLDFLRGVGGIEIVFPRGPSRRQEQ
jgi:hypothetical protein